MFLVTKKELETLTQPQKGPFLSIFMPTHKAGPETQKGRIRLKNLLKQAEERLTESGLRAPMTREMLNPAQALLDDGRFWQHQGEGLAIFIAPHLFRTYQLPIRFEELLVVTDRFHLKPLMPLLSDDGKYFVLAISQNQVRLFQGAKYNIDKIELRGVPTSLSEALKYDDPQKQHQFHTSTGTPGGVGKRSAIFHGHGVGSDDEQSNILRFCQHVDKGLQPIFKDEHAPLVLAGVEYLHPIYHKANTYSYLLEKGITGNPDDLSAERLHQQAWAIVEPYFQQSKIDAVKAYRRLANTSQASKDIRKIVPAAHYGKVDTLFVAVGQQQWGTFDPDTDTLQLHSVSNSENKDLLDVAAVETLLKHGTVYAVTPDDMPDESPLVAVFRY